MFFIRLSPKERERFCLVNYSARNAFCLAGEMRVRYEEHVIKLWKAEFSHNVNCGDVDVLRMVIP